MADIEKEEVVPEASGTLEEALMVDAGEVMEDIKDEGEATEKEPIVEVPEASEEANIETLDEVLVNDSEGTPANIEEGDADDTDK